MQSPLQQSRKVPGGTVNWPLLWEAQLDADVQLGAEAQVRKEEEELRLEKNMRVSPALLPLVLADKVGELDNHLEALVCHFVKLGRCKLPWNKV